MFEDLKAQHAAERPAFEQELAELKEQNRQVQAAASAKWDAARKAQVSLRRAEEQGEQLAEEFLVRQRQLEQQNLRLRKALSALKTRLFGWKQTKRRLVTRCEPSEERPSISPASLWLESAALESSNRSAAGLTPRPGTPKSPAASLGASLSPASRGSRSPMRASRGNTPRSGSRRPDDEHAQMRECLRNAEERARQAQAELAAAQARLTALEQRQRSLEPKEERTGSSVPSSRFCLEAEAEPLESTEERSCESKQEKGTEVAGEAHPEWRAEPEDPGDLKHTTPTSPDEKSHGLSDTSPSSPPVPWAGSASTSTRSSEFR
ncbi:unnamed protein product [Durusdinium trenchii]|uniref:Uncharacterized protein n=1 Tax=Durusdinium trenchii TaxID=1381693 RepID=A0ABP0MNH1_9DINO